MPRLVRERISLRLENNRTAPSQFDWQGRRYLVQSVEACWKAIGPWWDGDGERTYFRLLAQIPGQPAGVYELCYHHESSRWFLETVVD